MARTRQAITIFVLDTALLSVFPVFLLAPFELHLLIHWATRGLIDRDILISLVG